MQGIVVMNKYQSGIPVEVNPSNRMSFRENKCGLPVEKVHPYNRMSIRRMRVPCGVYSLKSAVRKSRRTDSFGDVW